MELLKTFIIPKELNPIKFDEITNSLLNAPNVMPRLSSKGIKFGTALGLEHQIILLLASWYRSNNSSKTIRTYVDETSNTGFEDLCQSMLGMAYLTLCDNILSRNGQQKISKSEAFKSATESIEKLQTYNFKEAFKGRNVFFPCLKPSKGNGKISPLYRDGKVASRGEFKYIFLESLKALLSPKELNSLNNTFFINMGSCIYELFKNTEDHSLKDEVGNYYLKSVRGISLSVSTYKQSDLHSRLGDNHKDYINSLYTNKENRLITFLEVSIVDTGIGYSKSWLRYNNKGFEYIDINAEVETVLTCFKKHRTTRASSSAGSGLSNVIDCLTDLNAGFILRTGRIQLSCFTRENTIIVDEKSIKIAKNELVGTSFTIVVPLIFKEEC